MNDILATLNGWLENRVSPYRAERVIEGTYGLVTIFETADTTVSPRTWCGKTVNPRKFETVADLESLFRREMRAWLTLPAHAYVVPALGLDLVPAPASFRDRIPRLPLVRMPYCHESLSNWVQNTSEKNDRQRCLALAQVLTGLQWLYEHGFEGHGDLKPDNLLVRFYDVGEKEETDFAWRARVSDLGWADVWREGRGTYHAWRPYLAPERFDGTFIPQASDIFAMGVIVCELFTGKHPAGGFTCNLNRTWNKRDWRRWARNGARTIDTQSQGLTTIIKRCLDPDPEKRPRPKQLADLIFEAVDPHFAEAAAHLINQEDAAAREMFTVLHEPHVAEEMARLGDADRDLSIDTLMKRLEALIPQSAGEVAEWVAKSLGAQGLLLSRGNDGDRQLAARYALLTIEYLLSSEPLPDIRIPVYGRGVAKHLEPDEVIKDFVFQAIHVAEEVLGAEDSRVQAGKARVERQFGAF